MYLNTSSDKRADLQSNFGPTNSWAPQAAVGLTLIFLTIAFPLAAVPITWTNTSGGSWSVATNWSPNSVPGTSDSVFITNNGTYAVKMDVSPTVASLTVGGMSGQQTLTNTSQTLTVNQPSVVSSNGILGLNGGNLGGPGTLGIAGQLQWNGGNSGAGFALSIQTNGVANIYSTIVLAGGFTNQGTVNWLAGNVNINTNGSGANGGIWNLPGAIFDIQCNQALENSSFPGTFHNAGLLRKRTAAGATSFDVFLDNSGTVEAQSGTIYFALGSNLGGIFQADTSAAIAFDGGAFTLSSPPNFQGPGTVQLTAGSLTLNQFTGILTLDGIGLIGQNTVAAAGTVNLNGSNLGSGASLTVRTNGVLNINATVTLAGVFTNQGTVNWLAGNVNINTNATGANGEIWNLAGGLFDIQCNQSVQNSGLPGTFHNAGLLRKRTTSGATSFDVFLDNSGTVEAQSGSIYFALGSNLGGIFQADTGAAIAFNGGNFTLSSPPNFQGSGTVQLTTGNLTLNQFTGTLTLDGIGLVGQNTVAAAGTINLNGSNLGAGASLTVLTNGVLNINSSVTLAGVFTNQGTVNWLAGNVNLNTNASGATGGVWNQAGGLFDIQCNQAVQNSGLPGTFHNAGLLRKRTATSATSFDVFFDNSGTVDAQSGTVSFADGGTLGGIFQADIGAAITFNGGNYTLSSPPNFQGAGSVQFTGGNLTLNQFTGTFALNGALLVGQNTVAATGTINLNGSNLGSGASLTVLTNGVLNINSSITLAGVFTNQGTVNWLAGNVNINTNASGANGEIWNLAGGLFDIQSNQAVENSTSPGTFHNAGLVRKRTATGGTSFDVFFDNSGTVDAQSGTVSFSDGGTLGGIFQADIGAAITFNGGTYTLSRPPNFQGAGSVQFTSGNLTLNQFTGTFTLNGTALVGQNTVAATGIINLDGSNLAPGASLTVLTNGVLNINATVTVAGAFTNQGTVNWLAGNVNINTNAVSATGQIWNEAGGLFDIQCNQVLLNSSLPGTFHNAGLLRKSAGSGIVSLAVDLANAGTIQAQTGTIAIQGAYIQGPSANLAISLAGTSPATGYGQIQFSTAPNVIGTFALNTLNGFRPSVGDSFNVLAFPSATGDFVAMNGLDLGNGLRLAPRFSAGGLTLLALAYPVKPAPPLSLDLSLGGIIIAWPTNFTGWQLQFATNLVSPSWSAPIPISGSNNVVLPIVPPQRFYRLFHSN